MPICPKCGTYYIRPPCPECLQEAQKEAGEQFISGTFEPKTIEQATSPEEGMPVSPGQPRIINPRVSYENGTVRTVPIEDILKALAKIESEIIRIKSLLGLD